MEAGSRVPIKRAVQNFGDCPTGKTAVRRILLKKGRIHSKIQQIGLLEDDFSDRRMDPLLRPSKIVYGREQAQWTRRQEARLLPVSYSLVTLTVPAEMRGVFLLYPAEMVPVFFAAIASSLQALCPRRKFLGGEIGFTAILHTWTRRMLFHPHIHVLVPAVGLAPAVASGFACIT